MKKKRKRKNFEIKFLESLLRENPNFVEALRYLGEVYTRRGFYREGLLIDLKLREIRPDDPIVHYNLACSFSLLKDIDNAYKSLKKAVLLGYNDFSYLMKDKDLENLRRDRRFQQLIERLKNTHLSFSQDLPQDSQHF